MKPMKLALNGNQQNVQDYTGDVHPMLDLIESIILTDTVRGVSSRNVIVLPADNLVELIYDDDTVWLCPADSLEDIYPGSVSIKRDGETVFELPTELDHGDVNRSFPGSAVLKVFNLFAKKKVSSSIQELAKDLEKKQMGKL